MTSLETSDIEDFTSCHLAALNAGSPTYTDPSTGYKVMTSDTLLKRGRCCGCGCRHCPFAHSNVEMSKRPEIISNPALLHGSFDEFKDSEDLDILFWSGGKDSYLALRSLTLENSSILLLTTFDASSRTVAHQEVPITDVVRQAEALRLPLLGVPLHSHVRYEVRVSEALRYVNEHLNLKVKRVCNGDLHLESVKNWREDMLGSIVTEIGAKAYSPLFKKDYKELLADLVASGTPCTVCALGDEQCWGGRDACVKVGDVFDENMVKILEENGADGFGENGEFHTLAEVWKEGANRY